MCLLACLGTCSVQWQHWEVGNSGAVVSCNNWFHLQRMQQPGKWNYVRTKCPMIPMSFTLSSLSAGGCGAICRDVRGGSMLMFIGGRLCVFLWCYCGLCPSLLREGYIHQLEVQRSLPWVWRISSRLLWKCNMAAWPSWTTKSCILICHGKKA